MKKFLYLLLCASTIISGAAGVLDEWHRISSMIFVQRPHPFISGHTILKSERLKEGLLTISEGNVSTQDTDDFKKKGYELVRITTKSGHETRVHAFAAVAYGSRAKFVCNELVREFAALLRASSPDPDKVPELFDTMIQESVSTVLVDQNTWAKPLERFAAILVYNGTVFNAYKTDMLTPKGCITRIHMTPGRKADRLSKLQLEGRPLLCWFPNDDAQAKGLL